MQNNPKRDVLYAILAIDSYNQGYSVGLNQNSEQLGGAKIQGPADGLHYGDSLLLNK